MYVFRLPLIVGFFVFFSQTVYPNDLSEYDKSQFNRKLYYACVQTMPPSISRVAGKAKIHLFCDCYTGEMINSVNKKEYEAMFVDLDIGRTRMTTEINKSLQRKVKSANSRCSGELS